MERFWEVDALRGIAIIAMIFYHFLLDLSILKGYSAPNPLYAFIIAGMFIFLVGLSLSLSYMRAEIQNHACFGKYLRRGLRIFGWGLLITGITMLIIPDMPVIFGILHFIGFSVIISYPFLKIGPKSIIFLPLFVLPYFSLHDIGPWLLWLVPQRFATADYFPLIPWFSLVLLGMLFGFILYPKYKRRFDLPHIKKNRILKSLCTLGKRSLFVYLVHQPLLVLVIMFI
ncbi:MAG: heparan-alpha-glucosaminide N-acetyltransferase [Candidatus Aenigmatarchaeota archaeon]